MRIDYSLPVRFKRFVKKDETGEQTYGFVMITWDLIQYVEEFFYDETYPDYPEAKSVIILTNGDHLVVAVDYRSLEQMFAGYIEYKKKIRYFLPLN